jgi:hypothetical protein
LDSAIPVAKRVNLLYINGSASGIQEDEMPYEVLNLSRRVESGSGPGVFGVEIRRGDELQKLGAPRIGRVEQVIGVSVYTT